MFSKEDPNTKTQNSAGKSPSINMISEDTRVAGDIHSDNDIRISGIIKGEAHSKGRVIVTSAGRVEGNVRAKDADIAGKLDGELFIAGKLILRHSAVINGDIHTKTLLVEEGAEINGNCKMGLESGAEAKAGQENENRVKPLKEKTA